MTQYSTSDVMTPMRIAVCSGSCVVAAKVISIATAESGATRSTSLMSGQPAHHKLEADDEDESADDRHRDDLGGRTGDQDQQRKPDTGEDAGPTGLCPSRCRNAGARQRAARRQRSEEAAREVADALCDEVAGHVAAAAVGVRHGRGDARRPAPARRARPRPRPPAVRASPRSSERSAAEANSRSRRYRRRSRHRCARWRRPR